MNKILQRLSIIGFLFVSNSVNLLAQRGYYDAPYKRYEADLGTLSNGAFVMPKSYAQPDLQSEASDQVCIDMTATNASVEWTVIEAADGLVIRYCIPKGETDVIGVYVDGTRITGITLTSTWSWESLWNNGNPNNNGVVNRNPKKRFDEVRFKLPNKIPVNGTLKLVRESGNIRLDFVELEPVPAAITAPAGAAIYSGNGSTLQSFINANGGNTIFLPAGDYNVNSQLYFGVANTKFQGAGMWYSHINFTNATSNNGGLNTNASNVSYADLFLTTNNASRSNSYKAINGVYTAGSTIKNVWAEHFECGAWIANYSSSGPAFADGFTLSDCRFRNNYADGINLCKGTSNAIVEHCSFRNNGDDDMAIWCANNQECINNTFRYNTSENCWRASGVAIYGGKNNQAYNLLIKDNLEAGIRVNNTFPGVQFNTTGQHVFHDITLVACGTFNDLYNNRVGAIDLLCTAVSGTRVQNVRLYNIDVIDSKNDGIYFNKTAGDGFYNLVFENISIIGTGKEYPNNNMNNSTAQRGMFALFLGAPNGNGTYCGMSYSRRGGNAAADENRTGIGAFSWTAATGCALAVPVTGISISPASQTIAVGERFFVTGTVIPANASKPVVTYSVVTGGANASVNTFTGLVTGLAPGNAVVRATSADGSRTADCAVTVGTVSPTPFITSFTPGNGTDGSVITIRGIHFTGTTAVSFGGTNAVSFTIVSDSVLTAVVSGGSTGTVSVTNALGTGTANGFLYLPYPWKNSDVGTVAAAGFASWSNGTFSVAGSGADIYDAADEFQYVYQPVNGNVTITAKVTSLGNTNVWAKAGLMFRETLSAGAVNVCEVITIANGINFQYRAATGGVTTNVGGNTLPIPYWLRITRVGNVFTGYYSADSSTWNQLSTITVAMASNAYAGLVVTSHSDGIISNASFTNVSVQSAPVILSFTPTNAITGSLITIRGLYFTGTTAVTFGGVAAASFKIISDSVITAVVDNGSLGSVAITNSFGTGTSQGFNFMLCPGGINTSLQSNITGSSYQWQVNTGSNYTNLAGGTNYTGTGSPVLQLINIPSSWYGYQYRCLVNGTSYSNIYTLKFTDTWTGAGGTPAWENPANWSCGSVPDANTDVIINGGMVILSSNTSVRGITIKPGVLFTINQPYNLTVTH